MAAIDNFIGNWQMVDAPYTSGAAVTPSDTVDLTNVSRALWIGGAGTGALSVIMADGTTLALAGVPVGLLRLRCSRVRATGTGVTSIVALW